MLFDVLESISFGVFIENELCDSERMSFEESEFNEMISFLLFLFIRGLMWGILELYKSIE